MKQTLYELLELKTGATQAEIDTAYAAVKVRLQPGIDRADTDALNLSRLLKDGYRILSDPERRAGYDATIRAQWKLKRSQIVYESVGVFRIGLGVIITLALLIATGLWANLKLLNKSEDIRVEFAEIARQKKAEQDSPQIITIETLPAAAPGPGPARKPAQR